MAFLLCMSGSGWLWFCDNMGIYFPSPSVSTEYCLNTTTYLSAVAYHIDPFMTTVYQCYERCFQRNNVSCHKDDIMSNMAVQSTNLHRLCDGILSA